MHGEVELWRGYYHWRPIKLLILCLLSKYCSLKKVEWDEKIDDAWDSLKFDTDIYIRPLQLRQIALEDVQSVFEELLMKFGGHC